MPASDEAMRITAANFYGNLAVIDVTAQGRV
jgi:hypothetical protein